MLQKSLKILVFGVLVSTIIFSGCENKDKTENTIKPEIPIQAKGFEMSNVQLHENLFRDAMEVNTEYLLYLKPDRFLAWFRKEAGLEPKGEVYGGWESDGYILSGHSLGHYLSALSKQYQATGNKKIKKKLDYTIQQLALIQKENGNGYVSAIPDGQAVFEEISKGNIKPDGFSLNGANVPWYNLDKTFNGLTDAYLLAGNEQAREVVTKLADWAYDITKDLSPEEWQKMLSVEHGGMLHSLADVYAITGDPRHLELSQKFYHDDVMNPLAERRDELNGLHGNTQIPKVRGVARIHELTNNKKYETIAKYFWNEVVNAHTYVNGGNGSEEYFGAPNKLSDRLSQTTETCNTYNMLWLTRILFSWEPQGKYMDYYERALYNHILASQNPESGMYKYKGYLDMPARKHFSDPTDSFWCCVGTGMENHTSYGKDIYDHSGDSLYVNLFISSDLEWDKQNVSVTQETNFPVEQGSHLTISVDRPTELSLLIRQPQWWGKDMGITVNQEEVDYSEPKDGYVEIRRTFKDGDTIGIDLPMQLRIESMPDDENRIAFFYGPVLLNAVLDEDPPSDILKKDPSVPQLTGSENEILESLEPVKGKDLQFRAKGVAKIKNKDTGQWEDTDLNFKPHYATVHELYTVYMDRNKN